MEWKTVDMRPGANAKKDKPGNRPSDAKKQHAHSLLESGKRLADEAEQEEKAELEREAEQARQLEEEQLKQAEIAKKERLEREYQESLVLKYKSRYENGMIHPLNRKTHANLLIEPAQLAMHESLLPRWIAKNAFATLQKRGNYHELITDNPNSPSLVTGNSLEMCRLVKSLGLQYIKKY